MPHCCQLLKQHLVFWTICFRLFVSVPRRQVSGQVCGPTGPRLGPWSKQTGARALSGKEFSSTILFGIITPLVQGLIPEETWEPGTMGLKGPVGLSKQNHYIPGRYNTQYVNQRLRKAGHECRIGWFGEMMLCYVIFFIRGTNKVNLIFLKPESSSAALATYGTCLPIKCQE